MIIVDFIARIGAIAVPSTATLATKGKRKTALIGTLLSRGVAGNTSVILKALRP